MGARFEVDQKKLKAVKDLISGTPKRAAKAMGLGLLAAGYGFEGQFIARRLSGAGDNSLGRRSGALARSGRVTLLASGRSALSLGVRYSMGHGAPYARAHEGPPLGKAGQEPITSTRPGGWLAIPMADDLFYGATAKVGGPRDDEPLRLAVMGPGQLFLVRDLGNGDVDFRWVLKRSVMMKPRLHLLDDWRKYRRTAILFLKRALRMELKKK